MTVYPGIKKSYISLAFMTFGPGCEGAMTFHSQEHLAMRSDGPQLLERFPDLDGKCRTGGGSEAFHPEDLPEWDLSDLYDAPDSPRFIADMEDAKHRASRFAERYRGRISDLACAAPGDLAAAVKEFEALSDLLGRLVSYADLLRARNLDDPGCAKFHGDVQEKVTNISAVLIFFSLELGAVGDEVLDEALKNPDLGSYAPWLQDIRKDRPYQLDDAMERLFHERNITARDAWVRLFDETLSVLRFDLDGERVSLEVTLDKLRSADSGMRKMAAQSLASELAAHGRLFVHITNVLAKDKAISDRWRGFADATASRHLANRVEGQVVDALENAVVESYPKLSHRYYALKARWMGVDRLAYWDRNAPLPEQAARKIGWEEARSIVLGAYRNFSDEMADLGARFFEDRWIDATVREGKISGAFAHPVSPGVHPYILMNYQGQLRDLMTLAHELGHGIHQLLAARQGALMANTPLVLAETASVFGEMLTFRSLLDNARSVQERRALIAQKVEDMLSTVVRQIAFYRFEKQLHAARCEGELTAEQIADMWISTQRESLGPVFDLDSSYGSFWSYVQHFVHVPFYVYAYAFGDCLVNSLFCVYEREPERFQERYLDLLKAGGSRSCEDLMSSFGLDITKPAFWSMGLKTIEQMVDELE